MLGPPQPSEERAGARVLKEVSLTPFDFKSDGQGHASAVAFELSETEIDGKPLKNLNRVTYKVNDRDPAHAEFIGEGEETIEMGSLVIQITTTTRIDSDVNYFHTSVVRHLIENGSQIRSHEWHEDIERDFQ